MLKYFDKIVTNDIKFNNIVTSYEAPEIPLARSVAKLNINIKAYSNKGNETQY